MSGTIEGASANGGQAAQTTATASGSGAEANGSGGGAPVVASNGMVLLNGVLLNVQALQSKLVGGSVWCSGLDSVEKCVNNLNPDTCVLSRY